MQKDILGLRGVGAEQIKEILDTALTMRQISQRKVKKVPTLRGQTVIMAFFENSTRTKTSFEVAAKRLSADVISFSASTSSTNKGETLLDTARNLDAMNPDAMIIRHSQTGAPHLLAKHFDWSVINAGDGINEHPSQALLDMLTMRDHLGSLQGKTVSIVGDIRHSRVARSNIFGLTTMGAKVVIAGPGTMCPREFEHLGVEIRHSVDDVLEDSDVIMMLRIQRERLGRAVLPSIEEYASVYGLNMDRVRKCQEHCLIMHPGPINHGVEMMPDVVDDSRSVIMEQVTNGIAVRMALLYRTLRARRGEET
jgi:aspartate carbamoyltransferase catalytic subunit